MLSKDFILGEQKLSVTLTLNYTENSQLYTSSESPLCSLAVKYLNEKRIELAGFI